MGDEEHRVASGAQCLDDTKSRSTSVVVNAAVGSSMTITRAFVVKALAISTSC